MICPKLFFILITAQFRKTKVKFANKKNPLAFNSIFKIEEITLNL